MLTVVTWLWKSTGWRHGYTADSVNALERMVKAHVKIPHKFLCVTDMPKGIKCEAAPLWEEPTVRTIPGKPNCYKRLKAYSDGVREIFGDRFISLDLDVVILKEVTDIFTRKEDFIILKGAASPYNGSMWMMNTGARKKVWDDFDPVISPAKAKESKMASGKSYHGSDQAWVSHYLKDEKTWDESDGIYQYWNGLNRMPSLPENVRMIFFNGAVKPWDREIKRRHAVLYNEYMRYANHP